METTASYLGVVGCEGCEKWFSPRTATFLSNWKSRRVWFGLVLLFGVSGLALFFGEVLGADNPANKSLLGLAAILLIIGALFAWLFVECVVFGKSFVLFNFEGNLHVHDKAPLFRDGKWWMQTYPDPKDKTRIELKEITGPILQLPISGWFKRAKILDKGINAWRIANCKFRDGSWYLRIKTRMSIGPDVEYYDMVRGVFAMLSSGELSVKHIVTGHLAEKERLRAELIKCQENSRNAHNMVLQELGQMREQKQGYYDKFTSALIKLVALGTRVHQLQQALAASRSVEESHVGMAARLALENALEVVFGPVALAKIPDYRGDFATAMLVGKEEVTPDYALAIVDKMKPEAELIPPRQKKSAVGKKA